MTSPLSCHTLPPPFLIVAPTMIYRYWHLGPDVPQDGPTALAQNAAAAGHKPTTHQPPPLILAAPQPAKEMQPFDPGPPAEEDDGCSDAVPQLLEGFVGDQSGHLDLPQGPAQLTQQPESLIDLLPPMRGSLIPAAHLSPTDPYKQGVARESVVPPQ